MIKNRHFMLMGATIGLLTLAACGMTTTSTTNTVTTGTTATITTGTDRPTPPAGDRPRDQGFGGYTLTEEQKNTCGITVQTTEGPYYVQNTLQLADNMTLNYDNLDGEPLTLEGQVYGGLDDSDPIAGAKIEVRQADDSGKYHPQGNGDYSDYDPTQISLRGYILTDENGAYKISSIYPGLYEGRARHLHLRISADGYNPVITQLILPYEGDTPTPENDNVAQGLPYCQIIYGNPDATSADLTFDFRLKAEGDE